MLHGAGICTNIYPNNLRNVVNIPAPWIIYTYTYIWFAYLSSIHFLHYSHALVSCLSS